MSSFTRRIQRQQTGTKASIEFTPEGVEIVESSARQVFYRNRGRFLGVRRKEDPARLARIKREARNAERKAS